jgi:hypothetical protein
MVKVIHVIWNVHVSSEWPGSFLINLYSVLTAQKTNGNWIYKQQYLYQTFPILFDLPVWYKY